MMEYGSDFHWIEPNQELVSNCISKNPYTLFGIGRFAIGSLISQMVKEAGWKRIWMPSYFCPLITAYIKSLISVSSYPIIPGKEIKVSDLLIKQGEVLFVNNLFGINQKPDYSVYQGKITVIEDHTHDPYSDWSCTSQADWCFASLRKTIPLPDGGVLWSPAGHTLPDAPDLTIEHRLSSLSKFSAMLAKERYLNGKIILKQLIRDLFISGENGYNNASENSGISAISRHSWNHFPVQKWRTVRKHNYHYLARLLKKLDGLEIFCNNHIKNVVPFSVVILLKDSKSRDSIRKTLISKNIYPSVLWDLAEDEHNLPENIKFSQRMLSIHCDMRYSRRDMDYIYEQIKSALTKM